MMKGNNTRFGPVPVKEGEIHEVTIEGIGQKGDGIARIKGYVVVVPNVQKGDIVKVKIKAVRGKVSFGEVLETTGKAKETAEGEAEEGEETGKDDDGEFEGKESEDEDEDSDDEDDTDEEADEEKEE